MTTKTYRYYCPVDFVIERDNKISGDWTGRRGQACTGPWANFGYYFFRRDIISEEEIECNIGAAGKILAIETRRPWRINRSLFADAVGMPIEELAEELNAAQEIA